MDFSKLALGEIKKMRNEMVERWETAGFLEGLSGHVKENIAQLYECCKSTLIEKKMDINTIKKDLYRSKNMAKFSHYSHGDLFYIVELEDGPYMFPIATIERHMNSDLNGSIDARIELSSDLGKTKFEIEMRGSELIRWINIAVEKNDFVKLGE